MDLELIESVWGKGVAHVCREADYAGFAVEMEATGGFSITVAAKGQWAEYDTPVTLSCDLVVPAIAAEKLLLYPTKEQLIGAYFTVVLCIDGKNSGTRYALEVDWFQEKAFMLLTSIVIEHGSKRKVAAWNEAVVKAKVCTEADAEKDGWSSLFATL